MYRSIISQMLCTAALLSVAGGARAHELFVKLDTHFVEPQSTTTLKVFNGTFEASAAPTPRDRMRDVTIVGPDGRATASAQDWRDVDGQSHLTIKTGAPGTYVAGVSSQYAVTERSASEFAEYLKLEGIPDLLARYDASKYPKGVRYRYAKHARALVQVGDSITEHTTSLGYPTEVVLQTHPAKIAQGQTVSFKATYKGAPLAGQLIHVGASESQELRTNKDGIASFKVTEPGIWYVHFNRMEAAETPGFDFESDRASLTFEVRPQ